MSGSIFSMEVRIVPDTKCAGTVKMPTRRCTFAHCGSIRFSRNQPIVIEILDIWTRFIFHVNRPEHLDSIMRTGSVAGGLNVQEESQACYFSAADLW